MKLFDCFLYNGEKEILTLRMELMGPFIDYFVIIEANISFSGTPKPLMFKEQKNLFQSWMHKVIYHPITEMPKLKTAWEREHYLRNLLKEKAPAEDDDLIIIADADEIVNIPGIRGFFPIKEPTIIELPTFYHFVNIKSNEVINVTLISPLKKIINAHIGDRNKYKDIANNKISESEVLTGGHFTYIFGEDLGKYVKKIKGFSHQEFNNSYFLNKSRIKACVKYNLDLFERKQFKYKQINLKRTYPEFYDKLFKYPEFNKLIKPKGLLNCIYLMLRFTNKYYLKNFIYNLRLKFGKIKRKIICR